MKSLHTAMQAQCRLKASMLISYCVFQYQYRIFKPFI